MQEGFLIYKSTNKKVMAKSKNTAGYKNIRFLLSPTGQFNLAYSAGENASIEEKQAEELVSAGYAEYVNETDKADVLTSEQKLHAENEALKELNKKQFQEIENLKATARANNINVEIPAGAVNGLTGEQITGTESFTTDAENKNTGNITKAGEETVIIGEGNQPNVKITKGAETDANTSEE